jgi:glucose/arabinose dehydrogenase
LPALWLGLSLSAATVPENFLDSLFSGGLSNATAMAFAPDGRIFVCEQAGSLRVIRNGVLLSDPFVSVPVSSIGERGLLGIAFDPNFNANGYVYVYYTAVTPTIHNRVSRFTAAGDRAAAGIETVVLELNDLTSATNHNGGAIHFGPDGKLYIGAGENGNGGNAQTTANLLGKILRINSDGTIPPDNPFVSSTSGQNGAIWALGLRNPFTFAFQRGTGRMFINDVGERTWEEINDGRAGANYGWPLTEGETTDSRFVSPLFVYGHGESATTGCAIAGGAFYNPPLVQFPADYVGKYFFADLCSGWIRRYDPVSDTVADFATGIASPVDLHVADDGSLYYLTRTGVYRIRYTVTTVIPADLNGDGRSDVLLYVPKSGASFTSLSDGAGAFSYVSDLWSAGFTVLRLSNGNTTPDLILYNRNSGGAYLGSSNGSGKFTFEPLGWAPGYDIVTRADLNGDGTADVILYNATSGTAYTAIKNGSGGFSYHYNLWSPGYTDIIVGDWNGDHRSDLVLYNRATGTAYAGINNGTGSFVFSGLSWSPGFDIIQPADLNGDGKTDLVLYNAATGTAFSAISAGTTFSYTYNLWSAGFTHILAGRFNTGAPADVILYNAASGAAYFGAGNGQGTFGFSGLSWGRGYDFVAVRDLNGDGAADVVLYNSATGTEYSGINDGRGTFRYVFNSWGANRILVN